MGRTVRTSTAANFTDRNRADEEFAKGQDVGHGADHDCPQCRNARKAMKSMGLKGASDPSDVTANLQGTQPPVGDLEADLAAGGNEITGDGSGEPLPPIDPGAEGGPIDSTASQELTIEAMQRKHGFALEQIETTDEMFSGVPIKTPQPIDESLLDLDRTEAARQKLAQRSALTPLSMVMRQLRDSLDDSLEKHGLNIEWDGIYSHELIDALQEARPGTGVMIMQGYIPDDTRWHIELTGGGARAHIKFPDRDVAIMLAVLTLLDGRAGAEFERALAGYNQPEAVAYFTGITRASV